MRSFSAPVGRIILVLLLTLNFLENLYSGVINKGLQYSIYSNSLEDITISGQCILNEIRFVITTDNVFTREIEVSIVEDDFVLFIKKVIINNSDTTEIKFNSNGLIYKVILKDYSNSELVSKEKYFTSCNTSNHLGGKRTLSAESYSTLHLENRFLLSPFGISTARHTEDAHFVDNPFRINNLYKHSDNIIMVDLLSKVTEANLEFVVMTLNGQIVANSRNSIQEGKNLISIKQNSILYENVLLLQILNRTYTVTKIIPVRY